jgi:dephospho-CoA kinase
MKETILSISGKPGLFRLLAQGNGNLILETLDETKKRVPAGNRDRVTSLRDVSMYTLDEDMPLMQVFENMKQKENGAKVALDPRKASKEELFAYLEEVLPNCDTDRIYPSDVKKLIKWYNILVEVGYTDFAEEETEEIEYAE